MGATSQLLRDDWDRHWNDFSAASEMGPATRYRQKLATRLLSVPPPGTGVRVLDIGSGTGGFAEFFCQRFPAAQLLGLELSRTGTELAAKRVPRARFVQRDLMAPLPASEAVTFGATHAVCSEVIEHLDDPVTFLRAAQAYMAPNCRIVVTVPGGKPNAFDRYIGHRRHYDAHDLKKLLQETGFIVELATGAGFPFFNLYRMATTCRGERLKRDVSGTATPLVRWGTLVFGLLFHLNLTAWGCQTVAVARSRPLEL